MVDLEYLLQREGEQNPQEFFDEEISPWIEPGKTDRPDSKTMSRALWRWLQVRREAHQGEVLPGQAIHGAQAILGFGLIIGMLMVGSGLIMGMLRYDGRTFNILLLLALSVGMQWLFLVLGLIGFVTWGFWKKRPFATLAQQLLFRGTEKLARKTLGAEATRWWLDNRRMRSLFALPTLQLTQLAGIAFNIGTIATLMGCVLFLAVRFGWETTPERSMNDLLSDTTEAIAFPWAWAESEWVPTREDIENTRIDWVNGKPDTPSVAESRSWYPFFLASMVCWGLLPRILFWGILGARQAQMIRNYSFQERIHREWWRELTALAVDTASPGPSDGAIALHWGGMKPDPERLRVYGLQQMRVHMAEQHRLGGMDLSEDEAVLQKASSYIKKHDGARIIIVAEAWSLAPKDFREFHEKLRDAIGPNVVIEVLLLGLPKGENFLTEPKSEEVDLWQRFAGELGDPAFYVRPCKLVQDDLSDLTSTPVAES